jgi:hypothetical protein
MIHIAQQASNIDRKQSAQSAQQAAALRVCNIPLLE